MVGAIASPMTAGWNLWQNVAWTKTSMQHALVVKMKYSPGNMYNLLFPEGSCGVNGKKLKHKSLLTIAVVVPVLAAVFAKNWV
jgi:hypothetical protein